MKKIRTIAFILVLLAQMVILGHNSIPHHHHHHQKHECHTECCCHNHAKDVNVHLCDTESCTVCTFLSDPFEHSPSFGQTILEKFSKIKYYFPEDISIIINVKPCICKISQICSGSSGFRAPPSNM